MKERQIHDMCIPVCSDREECRFGYFIRDMDMPV